MPVKILLADRSITIQKVVEMLFSGKDYAVTAVSDGEAALSEASRITPDVVLADVDLPRMDGYSFCSRLKQNSALARTPVILMMSRDDVYDEAKGQQAGIADRISKPFESQELIGKVKKAIAGAPAQAGETAPRVAAPRPAPPASAPTHAKPRASVPSDIFDIIQEAPSRSEILRTPAESEPQEQQGESVYEVEPEIEMEEEHPAHETELALPHGEKAREEMRANLGLRHQSASQRAPEPEPFDAAQFGVVEEPPRETTRPRIPSSASAPVMETPAVSEGRLQAVAEETIARIAREVLERVAWEIVPQLAETMIREEIEKLKAETMPR